VLHRKPEGIAARELFAAPAAKAVPGRCSRSKGDKTAAFATLTVNILRSYMITDEALL
jgi:hypothetical protein